MGNGNGLKSSADGSQALFFRALHPLSMSNDGRGTLPDSQFHFACA
jgi:hypothetical protein